MLVAEEPVELAFAPEPDVVEALELAAELEEDAVLDVPEEVAGVGVVG